MRASSAPIQGTGTGILTNCLAWGTNMKFVKWLLIAALLVTIAAIGAGQAGLLAGSVPSELGVHDGRLAPPATTPNSVSSQADLHPSHPQQAYARIAPLTYTGEAATAMKRLAQSIRPMEGATVILDEHDYLYVQFRTRWLGFVDDAEFWLDPATRVIHVRSASRLGESDLGLNRQRIDLIRQRFNP